MFPKYNSDILSTQCVQNMYFARNVECSLSTVQDRILTEWHSRSPAFQTIKVSPIFIGGSMVKTGKTLLTIREFQYLAQKHRHHFNEKA